MSVIKSFCACPRLFIQDWGFVDHWPRVSKSFKKYPEFCFIKWWKGSQVLRKEFRLKVSTENSRPPYLLGTIFSSLPSGYQWEVFSRVRRGALSSSSAEGRTENTHEKPLEPRVSVHILDSGRSTDVACLYPLSPLLVHQDVPWKSLKERALTTAG